MASYRSRTLHARREAPHPNPLPAKGGAREWGEVDKGAVAPCPPGLLNTEVGTLALPALQDVWSRMTKAATAAGISQGQCLCGKVGFEIDVPARWAWNDPSRA